MKPDGEVSLHKLVSFLDSELALAEFPRDESANGLQVEGKTRIRRIGVAVDACQYIFQRSASQGVDFLLVHHGLIWGGIRSLRGVLKKRVKTLLDSDISLYACHLPLDWHPIYGNNAQILESLSLKKMGEFGEYHGKRIGYWGRTKKEIPVREFVNRVDSAFRTRSSFVEFGKKVRNVGVVSGGGWSAIYDAEKMGIDTFLTGEPSHSAHSLAEELKVNLVFSGHYATEVPGVRAVGNMLSQKLGIQVDFIDHPTGL